jgi:hypothetical protein
VSLLLYYFLTAALPAQAEHAVLSVSSGNGGCYDLLAGQSIDAGDVCLAVDKLNENLTVTYSTQGGWELVEAHLWVGEILDAYPATKKGKPRMGNFPYNSMDITGATEYSFTVPRPNGLGTTFTRSGRFFGCRLSQPVPYSSQIEVDGQ